MSDKNRMSIKIDTPLDDDLPPMPRRPKISFITNPTPQQQTDMALAWKASEQSECPYRHIGARIVSKSDPNLAAFGTNTLKPFMQKISDEEYLSRFGFLPTREEFAEEFSSIAKAIVKQYEFLGRDLEKMSEEEKILVPESLLSKQQNSTLDFMWDHAEANAIKAAKENGIDLTDATLYTTKAPCENCAAAIVEAKIGTVVAHERGSQNQMSNHWQNSAKTGHQILSGAGINCFIWPNDVQMDPNIESYEVRKTKEYPIQDGFVSEDPYQRELDFGDSPSLTN